MKSDHKKVFCLPFSGGNFYSYSSFRKYFPPEIELINLELPGRGRRAGEKLLFSIEEMTLDLYNQIRSRLEGDYYIYGHSLGALLGLMLCRHMHLTRENLPRHLFLSGHKAPCLLEPDNKHNLPENEFVEMLREMDGTPDELLRDKGFLQFFLPVIRADFHAIAIYEYRRRGFPMGTPITLMVGNDEDISDSELMPWKEETDGELSVYRFKGGHFFIFSDTEQLCDLIVKKINTPCL